MKLNKNYNCFKFETLDLIQDIKYDREIGREFYKELSSDSARDSKREKRPLRMRQWCEGIFNIE